MSFPLELRYSESHEWYRLEGDWAAPEAGAVVTIGISQHAVDQLTDVTFVEMKPVGTELDGGDPIGEVESVKTASEIYSAVAGEIVEINTEASDAPTAINDDCYGGGWLAKIKITDPAGLAGLFDAETYEREHTA